MPWRLAADPESESGAAVPHVCKDRIFVPDVCTYMGRFFYEFILLIQEMSPHIKILQKFRVEPILVASKWAALRAILSSFSTKSEKPLRNHAEKK